MRTVVLSGYYGFDNAGDEALLAAIVGTLQKLRPDIHLMVFSANPERTQKMHGVEAISRFNIINLIKTLRRADLLLSGGGSLLQDVTSWRSILYYLGVVMLALWLKTPVMFYAQGIGPIRRTWARWLTRQVGNRVQLITLRDEDSYQELRLLGVSRPPIYVTADPVLGMDLGIRSKFKKQELGKPAQGTSLFNLTDSQEPIENLQVTAIPNNTQQGLNPRGEQAKCFEKSDNAKQMAQTCYDTSQDQRTKRFSLDRFDRQVQDGGTFLGLNRQVGFALRDWKKMVNFKKAAAQAADYLAGQGWQIVFIPLHYPEDLQTAREVAQMMKGPSKIIEDRISVQQMLQEIAQLDFLVGMRLHSLIFAAALGIPFLGISYDPKVTAFLDQFEEKPIGNVEDITAEKLIQSIEELISHFSEKRAKLLQRSEYLAQLARKSAELALDLLDSEKQKK